ncbi:MAG TPA: NAD(P)/FAD-dependent oxidoreductase [Acidimicrobiia bacterium]|nr:NAD(P)/FAD-dependent oxidoreductase [Acidimicrobiia bacterium]
MPAEIFDVVVAGAGHNSLVTAAYLARAGLRCRVLEARPRIGGNTATEELTLPGFQHDSCSTAHNLIQASPTFRLDELNLADFGLEYIQPDPVVHLPFPDGTSLTMWRDLDRTVAEFERFSKSDGVVYRRMMEEYDRVKDVFGASRYTPFGLGPSLEERLSEHPEGDIWRKRNVSSAWDIIRAEFDHPNTRAFMLWMAFMTVQPPQRSGTGRLAYSLAFGRQTNSWIVPKGGSAALPLALSRVIEANGGEIIVGRRVDRLILENGRCVGVVDETGEEHRASQAVLSTIHIKHLVEMAPKESWGDEFIRGVDGWRAGISLCPAHYATTEAPEYDTPEGKISPLASGLAHTCERLLRIEYDFHTGVVALDDPPLLVLCPTVADPGRAPDGRHTLKVLGFHPYELAEGPQQWDDIQDVVAEAHLAHLRRYAPNLTDDTILAKAVKSPLELERTNAHNWHGSCHAGDHDPAQSGAFRPVYGWAQHRMPIPGLYQTGATTHPGPSVSAGPGRNAAWIMLDDLGIDRRKVFADVA